MNELSPSISSNITLLVFRARRVSLEAIGRYQPGDRQTDRQTERQKERDREREREAERKRARAVKTVLVELRLVSDRRTDGRTQGQG